MGKAEKQLQVHPLKDYLAECMAEWAMYNEMLQAEGWNKPVQPYPYTEEMIKGYLDDIRQANSKETEGIFVEQTVAAAQQDAEVMKENFVKERESALNFLTRIATTN